MGESKNERSKKEENKQKEEIDEIDKRYLVCVTFVLRTSLRVLRLVNPIINGKNIRCFSI